MLKNCGNSGKKFVDITNGDEEVIVLKCPTCGANMEVEDNREFAFCTYCGTKVYIQSDTGNIYSLSEKANKFLKKQQNNPQEKNISDMVDTIVDQMLKQYPTHYLSYLLDAKRLSDNFTVAQGTRSGGVKAIFNRINQAKAFASDTELLEIEKEILPYTRKLQDYIFQLEDNNFKLEEEQAKAKENLEKKNILLVKNINKFPQLISGLTLSRPIDRGRAGTSRIRTRGTYHSSFQHNNILQYTMQSGLSALVYLEDKAFLSNNYKYQDVNTPVIFNEENILCKKNGMGEFLLENKTIKVISLERTFFAGTENDRTIYKWTFLHGNELKTEECWIPCYTENALTKLGFREYDLSSEEKNILNRKKYDLTYLRKCAESLVNISSVYSKPV